MGKKISTGGFAMKKSGTQYYSITWDRKQGVPDEQANNLDRCNPVFIGRPCGVARNALHLLTGPQAKKKVRRMTASYIPTGGLIALLSVSKGF